MTVVLDARRFPATVIEHVDVALARQYRDQAQAASDNVEGSAGLIGTALQPGAPVSELADTADFVKMEVAERGSLQALESAVLVGGRPAAAPFVFTGVDVQGRKRRFGAFRGDGAFVAQRWGIGVGVGNGGLALVTDADGFLTVSLGTVPGRLPIGTGGRLYDTANPAYVSATTVTDHNGRVRRAAGVNASGVVDGAVMSITPANGNGGVSVSRGAGGAALISLGTVAGRLPIGTGGLLIDNANPRYTLATTISDAAGRVRKTSGVTVDGANDAEVLAARGTQPSLVARLNRTQRADGLALTERFGAHLLCETRSKIGDVMAGASALLGARLPPYQLVINTVGNSWLDNPDFWTQRLVRRLRSILGDAGAGFVCVERGCADPAVATITKTGAWTVVNAATAAGINCPSPHIQQIISSTAGDKIRINQLIGASDSVALFALGNGAVVSVSKNGAAAVNRTLSTVSTNLASSLAAGDYLEIAVVSGEATLYGADLRRNQTGVRWNKLGASSSTWPRWLEATATDWQAGLAALGGDLTIMMESINGANSWDAAQEVAHTTAMVGRVRAALPLTDILLLSPPVTLATTVYSLSDRAYALRAFAAADGKMAHLDLQYAFGEPGSYGDAGHQFFLSTDPNHASIKGRPLTADAVFRMLMNA